jgi:hypothetical protein
MSPFRRWCAAAAAIASALVLLAVSLQRVSACSCAMTTLPEAVREADVAFVGQLVDHMPGGDNFGFPPLDEWRWAVERSRDPGVGATIATVAAMEDGANCGVLFAPGERWLILAHESEGQLHTNGCLPNRLMDAGDAEVDALVAGFVPVSGAGSTGGRLDVPVPILVAAAAAGAMAVVGLLAFRRERVS